jgi:hypothetical protein
MARDYEGLERAERWGCAAGALVGAPVFLFLFGLDALGDCAPNTACIEGFWLTVAFPSVLASFMAFVAVRFLIRRAKGDGS